MNANFPAASFPSYVQIILGSQAALENAMSNAGMRVWASQKENTNLGPVIKSLGRVSPEQGTID